MCFASFRARISFFHFSSRTPFDRGLDDLYPTWSCAHWLAVHRCDVELRKARSKKDSRTRWRGSSRVEELELETLTALVQQSPFSRRRLSSEPGASWRRRWNGAVVPDNCETDARTQLRIHTHNTMRTFGPPVRRQPAPRAAPQTDSSS